MLTASLKIQASIQGFSKDAGETLFAALSRDNDVCVVANSTAFTLSARDGFYMVSSIKSQDRRDFLFEVASMQDAIAAYLSLDSRGLLVIGDKLQRFNPSNKIDQDGFDDKGPRYKLSPDIGSGHIAVMAIALAAKKQIEAKSVSNATVEMANMFEGIYGVAGEDHSQAVISRAGMFSWI